jgi:hypothetical protein
MKYGATFAGDNCLWRVGELILFDINQKIDRISQGSITNSADFWLLAPLIWIKGWRKNACLWRDGVWHCCASSGQPNCNIMPNGPTFEKPWMQRSSQ